MKRRLMAVCVAALAGMVMFSASAQEPTAWKAGAAAVKITPETPIWMAGYAGRKKPSEGVAADLFAKALAIEDPAGTRLVIVTLDLISVPRTLRDWLEAAVQEKHGLKRSSLLMNCSHTHCGPELRARDWRTTRPRPRTLPPRNATWPICSRSSSCWWAMPCQRLAPARLDFLRARAGFAMNRRRPTPQGYSNAPYFEGPVDHEVPVLRVTDPQGKLVAVLFGYACHNTTMGDYLIRGDYAGYAQQYLEEEHPGMTALFMIGCGADQNPYPRSKEELAKYHGRALALAVEAALQTPPKPLRGPLCSALEDVTLDFAPFRRARNWKRRRPAARNPMRGTRNGC